MNLVAPDHPALWTPAAPVTDLTAQVYLHLPDMKIVMLQNGGIGLAAPQVGLGLRFFVTRGNLIPSVIINPEVIRRADTVATYQEGCLSLPGKKYTTTRPTWIEVTFTNFLGATRELQRFEGTAAQLFLHEMDHLDGVCVFPRSS